MAKGSGILPDPILIGGTMYEEKLAETIVDRINAKHDPVACGGNGLPESARYE